MDLILRNHEGLIVAKLYITKTGELHPDSWIKYTGWSIKNLSEQEKNTQ